MEEAVDDAACSAKASDNDSEDLIDNEDPIDNGARKHVGPYAVNSSQDQYHQIPAICQNVQPQTDNGMVCKKEEPKRARSVTSKDPSDMCTFQCPACRLTFCLEEYLTHVRTSHPSGSSSLGEGRSPGYRMTREVYHCCRICQAVYLFTNQHGANHCRRLHNIKFKDYVRCYLKKDVVRCLPEKKSYRCGDMKTPDKTSDVTTGVVASGETFAVEMNGFKQKEEPREATSVLISDPTHDAAGDLSESDSSSDQISSATSDANTALSDAAQMLSSTSSQSQAPLSNSTAQEDLSSFSVLASTEDYMDDEEQVDDPLDEQVDLDESSLEGELDPVDAQPSTTVPKTDAVIGATADEQEIVLEMPTEESAPLHWYDGTQFRCKGCSYVTYSAWEMEVHATLVHAVSAPNFPRSFSLAVSFFSCNICSQLICREKSAAEFHLGNAHGYTLADYETVFNVQS
jgi:hypothetical protein